MLNKVMIPYTSLKKAQQFSRRTDVFLIAYNGPFEL